jgi:hypothetical protein
LFYLNGRNAVELHAYLTANGICADEISPSQRNHVFCDPAKGGNRWFARIKATGCWTKKLPPIAPGQMQTVTEIISPNGGPVERAILKFRLCGPCWLFVPNDAWRFVAGAHETNSRVEVLVPEVRRFFLQAIASSHAGRRFDPERS